MSDYDPSYDEDFDEDFDTSDEDDCDFADPGGVSALRAATATNPRNLPCPNCEEENMLTPRDVALHYQCDDCANRLEMGF